MIDTSLNPGSLDTPVRIPEKRIKMKSTILLSLYLLLLSFAMNAQDFGDYYSAQLDEGSKFLWATYHQLAERTADGKYVLKIFYPEKKQITHRITYADKKLRMVDGPYAEWYDNGYKWKEGQMKDGQRSGYWTTYSFEHGGKTGYGQYEDGQEQGKWLSYDSLGRVTSEFSYLHGRLHGESRFYDEEGELTRISVYEGGELISSEEIGEKTSDGDTPADGSTYKVVEEMPFLKGCENDDPEAQKLCSQKEMLISIYSNIKYPPIARENGLEGTALFSFVIEKDGSLTNLTTIRGLCQGVEEECRRVISELPEWNPGKQRGKLVRVRFNLPIKFKLE